MHHSQTRDSVGFASCFLSQIYANRAHQNNSLSAPFRECFFPPQRKMKVFLSLWCVVQKALGSQHLTDTWSICYWISEFFFMFCGSLSNACDLREEENYRSRCSEMLFSLETGYLLFGKKKKKSLVICFLVFSVFLQKSCMLKYFYWNTANSNSDSTS